MAASSESRKKKSAVSNVSPQQAPMPEVEGPNPVWFKPLMFGFMLLGLIWIIVFYLSGSMFLPIPALGQGNIFVGFGIMFVGFLMTTRWR